MLRSVCALLAATVVGCGRWMSESCSPPMPEDSPYSVLERCPAAADALHPLLRSPPQSQNGHKALCPDAPATLAQLVHTAAPRADLSAIYDACGLQGPVERDDFVAIGHPYQGALAARIAMALVDHGVRTETARAWGLHMTAKRPLSTGELLVWAAQEGVELTSAPWHIGSSHCGARVADLPARCPNLPWVRQVAGRKDLLLDEAVDGLGAEGLSTVRLLLAPAEAEFPAEGSAHSLLLERRGDKANGGSGDRPGPTFVVGPSTLRYIDARGVERVEAKTGCVGLCSNAAQQAAVLHARVLARPHAGRAQWSVVLERGVTAQRLVNLFVDSPPATDVAKRWQVQCAGTGGEFPARLYVEAAPPTPARSAPLPLGPPEVRVGGRAAPELVACVARGLEEAPVDYRDGEAPLALIDARHPVLTACGDVPKAAVEIRLWTEP